MCVCVMTQKKKKAKSSPEVSASLQHLYLGKDSPYALSGNTQQLLEVAHSLGIPRKDTERYLEEELSFTLHRPRRVQFPRSKTVVGPRLDSTWQADLVEMQHCKLIATNRRTRYLLTIIDVLSKYAWVVGLKSKRGTAVRDAFQHVLETHPERRPTHLQTDQGKEFYNKHMKRLLDDYDINHYSTRGEPKAAVGERFNRTLKEMMNKYMTARNTSKYLDALPDLVHKYNTRLHQDGPRRCLGDLASSVQNQIANVARQGRAGAFLRTPTPKGPTVSQPLAHSAKA